MHAWSFGKGHTLRGKAVTGVIHCLAIYVQLCADALTIVYVRSVHFKGPGCLCRWKGAVSLPNY